MGIDRTLDDGRDEDGEELVLRIEQFGPEAVEEVDDQALDVRTVRVLVGHDHHVAVSELPREGLSG